MTSHIAIGTTRLTKDYGQGRGVFGLDLEVERGEILGFLGPSSRREVDDDAAAARSDLTLRPFGVFTREETERAALQGSSEAL